MSHSRELQEAERAGREAGRKECLDFIGKEDEELSRRLEAWLIGRGSNVYQGKDMLSPTSINDSLTPDLLYNIFKRLDCIQTTIVRRVCKKWFEIIDEHKSFWRILHLPDNSLEKWNPSVLEMFDRKSNSSLREVKIQVDRVGNFQGDLLQTLKRSRKSIQHLFIEYHRGDSGKLTDFLGAFTDLESLILIHPGWLKSCKVRINRKARASLIEGRQDASSCLQVLWYGQIGDAAKTDPLRFRNLASFDTVHHFSSSDLRKFLDGPSKTLKHLRIYFAHLREQEKAFIPSLDFPFLEVLETELGSILPGWITFPTSITLIDRGRSFNLNLPSISELRTSELYGIEDVQNRAPILQTLRFFDIYLEVAHWRKISEIVRKRWESVQAKLEVDGVEMEMIKALIVPFGLKKSELSNEVCEILEKLKELVENVIDGDSVPEIIEIEY